MLSPYRAKTGRNAPSNSRFIFGPSTWLRGLIKPEPGRAVLHGAVLYGLDRTRIRSRGMRRTYGCDTYLVFEPGRDPVVVPQGLVTRTA